MNLSEIMNKHDIKLEWLFVLSKLNNQEGLMFFEPVFENIDNQEVTNLNPKCFYIDGGKFIYDDTMDKNIIINSINKVITFTRIDGIQLNIDTSLIDGFPFKIETFTDKPISIITSIPEDFVELK